MPTSQKKPEKSQAERFAEAACELKADHESDADALMRRMAKMKPDPRPKKHPDSE
jgi:hypothetical protein